MAHLTTTDKDKTMMTAQISDSRPTIVSRTGAPAGRHLRSVIAAFIVSMMAVFTFTSAAFADTDLKWEGSPSHHLAEETYRPMTARQLKSAKVVWINKDYFEGRGVLTKSPSDLKALTKKIRDHFAFLLPTALTPESIFTDVKLTVYPDAYGGPGLNGNYGSGRAATVGEFELKGLGPTTMLGDKADADHSSGGVGATQAIAEAIWSVILHREAPHGSNQVVALIDTGLKEPLANGISQPRFLVVREDPLRPAHFVTNASEMTDERRLEDQRRTHDNIARLRSIMAKLDPEAKDASTDQLFLRFTDKVADQWAYLHANMIHHGAVTPSNIDLSGKMLDLSSVSTLPGAMLAMGHDLLPFGDEEVLDLYLLKPFFDVVAADSSSGLTLTYDKVQERLERSYHNSYVAEILKTVGTPQELASTLSKHESANQLFSVIETLRKAGYSDRVKTKVKVPEQKGQYDVMAILILVVRTPGLSSETAELRKLIPDSALRARLMTAYRNYALDLSQAAHAKGWSDADLKAAVEKNATLRNVDRKDLRRNFKTYLQKATRAVLAGWNIGDMQAWIDKSIDQSSMVTDLRSSRTQQEPVKPNAEKTPRLKALMCRFSAI